MAAKPLTSEAIALTEKKMDMTLGMVPAVDPSCFMLLSARVLLVSKIGCFLYYAVDSSCILLCPNFIADDIVKMSKKPPTRAKKQRASVRELLRY